MATIGLYHPFIHFKDDDWLKLSALYWDRMARIVPQLLERSAYDGAREGLVSYACPCNNLDYVVNIRPNEVTYPVSGLFTTIADSACGGIAQ